MDNIKNIISAKPIKKIDKKVIVDIKKEEIINIKSDNQISILDIIDNIYDIYTDMINDYENIINIYIKRAELNGEKVNLTNVPEHILRAVLPSMPKSLTPKQYKKILLNILQTSINNGIAQNELPTPTPQMDFMTSIISNLDNSPNLYQATESAKTGIGAVSNQGTISSFSSEPQNATEPKTWLNKCFPCTFDLKINGKINVSLESLLKFPLLKNIINMFTIDLTNLLNTKFKLLAPSIVSTELCSLGRSIYNYFDNYKCIPPINLWISQLVHIIIEVEEIFKKKVKYDVNFGLTNLLIDTFIKASVATSLRAILPMTFALDEYVNCTESSIFKVANEINGSIQQLDRIISIDAISEKSEESMKELRSIASKIDVIKQTNKSVKWLKNSIQNKVNTLFSYIINNIENIEFKNIMEVDDASVAIVASENHPILDALVTKDNSGSLSLLDYLSYIKAKILLLTEIYTLLKASTHKTGSLDLINSICAVAVGSFQSWIDIWTNNNSNDENSNTKSNGNSGSNNDSENNSNINNDSNQPTIKHKIIVIDNSINKKFFNETLDNHLKNSFIVNYIMENNASFNILVERYNNTMNELEGLQNMHRNTSIPVDSFVIDDNISCTTNYFNLSTIKGLE